jgi:signal transduction histidine kinase
MPLANKVSAEWAALRRAKAALRRSEETLRARGVELAMLRQVNEDLEDARRAALDLMADAVESRRQVDELNRKIRVTASCDRFQVALGDALRSLGDPVQIKSVACRVLAEHLAADRVSYADIEAEGDAAIIPPEFKAAAPLMAELRAGRTIVLSETGSGPSPIQGDSLIAAPLVKDGRLVAALCVRQDSARAWAPHAIELVHETAERTWAAVERARAEEALRQSEERLRRLNDVLEDRIRERTSELAGANTSLQIEVRERRAAESEIKALFTRLVSAQEDERRRIALDIHDQLGQQMTAVRINLEALQQRTDIDPACAESVEGTMRLAEELDRSIDFLTWQLRPAALDHLGLPAALAHLVGGWSQRFQVRADCDTVGTNGVRLRADVETNLYRLAQEALHNVYKHARATHVSVILKRRDHQIVLVVEDNGRGFAIADVSPEAIASLGLVSMRERAALVGGELTIESTPELGTAITVRVPITDADGAGV